MTAGKRLFDILFATVLLVVLSPVIAAVALAILVFDGGPVLYRSERMKGTGQPFILWKFRTMRSGTEDGGVSGGNKAARITATGRRLRRYRLDELPQLWNILLGDMSFVGPRPPLRGYVERFPDLYAKVLAARPGVTGYATLVYHRREEELLATCTTPEETDAVYSARCVPAKARLDLSYARRRTLCSDMALIAHTVARVFGAGRRPQR